MKKLLLFLFLLNIAGASLFAQNQKVEEAVLSIKPKFWSKPKVYLGSERIEAHTSVREKLMINEEALLAYNKGLKQQTTGRFLLFMPPVAFMLFASTVDSNNDPNEAPIASFTALGVTFISGLIFYSQGTEKLKSSAKIYNEFLKTSSTFSPSVQYSLIPISSSPTSKIDGVGMGLVMNF